MPVPFWTSLLPNFIETSSPPTVTSSFAPGYIPFYINQSQLPQFHLRGICKWGRPAEVASLSCPLLLGWYLCLNRHPDCTTILQLAREWQDKQEVELGLPWHCWGDFLWDNNLLGCSNQFELGPYVIYDWKQPINPEHKNYFCKICIR